MAACVDLVRGQADLRNEDSSKSVGDACVDSDEVEFDGFIRQPVDGDVKVLETSDVTDWSLRGQDAHGLPL